MDEDELELEAALRRLKEQALDVEALSQEYRPDLTTLAGLVTSLPADSVQRPALQLVAAALEGLQTDRAQILEQRVTTVQLLESVLGLHLRVKALEEIVTTLAERVAALERDE